MGKNKRMKEQNIYIFLGEFQHNYLKFIFKN